MALLKLQLKMALVVTFLMILSDNINTVAMANALQKQKYSAMFVIGDSLADVGNNNYIATAAKAGSPFGIDFPTGPTGRFSNGKLVIDFLCERLSLPFPPPYLAPTTRRQALLNGVNYASAAAGIIHSTGYNFLGRVDLATQVSWLANTVMELQQLIGPEKAAEFLESSLFLVNMGSNDYVNNYLLKLSPTRGVYTPPEFQSMLLSNLSRHLNHIYDLGARNIVVFSIGPIGCIPSQLAAQGSVNGECVEFVNQLALDFNQGLASVIDSLNGQLQSPAFFNAGVYESVLAYRNNPQLYGFKIGDHACCGGGKYNGRVLCLPVMKPCPDRNDYVFFDAYHPSEHSNRLLESVIAQQLNL